MGVLIEKMSKKMNLGVLARGAFCQTELFFPTRVVAIQDQAAFVVSSEIGAYLMKRWTML